MLRWLRNAGADPSMPMHRSFLLPILLYHHVGQKREPGGHRRLWISTERFERHLACLTGAGYRCLSLGQCVDWFTGSAAPPRRTVALTFDDAYVNFRDHAFPLLQRYGVGATVYVVTGEAGGVSRWDAGCETPLRDWSDRRRLPGAGVDVGAHTVTHPRLTTLSSQRASMELRDARETLEDRLGAPVTTVAYPYGDVNAAVGRLAADAGYAAGCTIVRGNRHHPGRRMHLKRVQVDDFTDEQRLLRRVSALYDLTCRLHRVGRRLQRMVGGNTVHPSTRNDPPQG